MRRRPGTAAVVVAALLAAVAAGGCGLAAGDDVGERFPLRAEAGRMLAGVRPVEARLWGASPWAPCAPGGDRALPEGARACAGAAVPDARAVAALAARAREAGGSADATWALAVADLAAAPGDPAVLDRVVAALEPAAADGGAAALNDLAVALLARATARRDVADAFVALDLLERAWGADSASDVVAHNRALALERLHAGAEARVAWAAAARLATTAGWREEASARAARPESGATPAFAAAVAGADQARLAALVRRDPQGAREYLADSLVRQWARAAAAGDAAATGAAVAALSRVAGALAAATGDSSAAHVARAAAMARGDGAPRAALDAAEAGALFRRGDSRAARAGLARAVTALRAHGAAPLADWTELRLAAAELYDERAGSAIARMARVGDAARARGDLALEGSALWVRALAEARLGRLSASAARYEEARALFARAGERPNEASMVSQQGDVLVELGLDQAVLQAHRDVLGVLADPPRPALRHGTLLALAELLVETGLPHAATAMLREAARGAAGGERAKDLPEALVRLARAELAAGRGAAARATLARARAGLAVVGDTAMRERMDMEVALAEAEVLESASPRNALERLDAAAAYLRRQRTSFRLAPVLSGRARALLALGDTARALDALGSAATLLDSLGVEPRTPDEARALAAVRRDLFGALAEVAAARGDTAEAFGHATRARGARVTSASVPADGVVRLGWTVRAGATLAWIRSGAGTRLVRLAAGADTLRAQVERLERLLRRGEEGPALDTLQRALYATLVLPAEPELARARVLELEADGALGRLPFAALRDAGGRHLVERVALRHRATTSLPVRRGSRGGRGDGVVVVGDPAFDRARFPELERLRGAGREADAVRALYPGARLLPDEAATKGALLAALGGARLLHFAGHARLVPQAPERSHLVLARDPASAEGNVLAAREIAQRDLRGLRLVVLSSCGTAQARSRRDEGMSGLSEAFLDAGAGAVVSSLWEVNDEGVVGLMTRLHREVAAGVEGAEALRRAQVEAMRVAPVRVWGAFRYEGR